MPIRSKTLEEMVRAIISGLRAGERGDPVFTLLLGSGFSVPIIPTPSQMLKGDIAWWRYWKEHRLDPPFCLRAEGIGKGIATAEQVAAFECEMWKAVHSAAASAETAFPLAADGLPDLSDPKSIGLAYQAVMAEGLLSNKMRRQYLRDAIARTYPRVNAAHIFLAGILEAQETWEWGAPFCRTIFTTNFDPLMQRSLQLVNKLYYMSDRPDVLEAPDDAESAAIHLVYTHGSVHRYDLRNTGAEIRKAQERNAPALVTYFQRHGVVVIGYSGWEDTTMEALQRCPFFDSNLYWCDIHPAAVAEQRLRPEVLEVLGAGEKNAFYVPIPDAGEAMRLLHRELKLGDVPKFILDPVAAMIGQLESIEVPTDSAVSSKPEPLPPGGTLPPHDALVDTARLHAAPLATSLADLRDGTLKRLRIAKSAFDDPAIVRPPTAQAQQDVASAITAKLFSEALVAYSQGKREQSIALLSTMIGTPEISSSDRAVARFNRAVILGEAGETTKAIADYTAVVEMADAPAEQKAKALYNRGMSWGQSGEPAKEIADYTAVVEMPDAPIEQKAKALYNRGVSWGQSSDPAKEIADYTAVMEMAGAPAEQRAKALYNRGVRWGESGDPAKEIADYTAVIEMADAPIEQKAMALNNRGVRWGKSGESAKAIADYTAVIDMADAPAEQKAMALNNRGVRWGKSGEPAKEIADYTAVIEMGDAPAKHKARALYYRGVSWGEGGETAKALADYTAVIEMADAPAVDKAGAFLNRGWRWYKEHDDVGSMIEDSRNALALAPDEVMARSNLALGLLLTGEVEAARAEYETLLSTSDAEVIRSAIADLESALQKKGEIPGAAEIIQRLRKAWSDGDQSPSP